MSLSLHEVKEIAKEGNYNLIPIYSDLVADLETPVSAFLKIRRETHSFLFESVEGGEHHARYSFIGTQPAKVIRENEKDPLIIVEKELSKYRLYPVSKLPAFTGGGVGYISYDAVRHFEPSVKIPDKNVLGLPETVFMFFRSLVIFDHVKHTLKIVAHIYLEDGANNDIKSLYSAALGRIKTLTRRMGESLPIAKPSRHSMSNRSEPPQLKSNHGHDGYCNFVKSLRKDIIAGNIIQAVPSHRICRPLMGDVSAFDIYRQLRVINPSPYMFYMDLDGFTVVGASPECLVKVKDGKVYNHPIAGTRKRGATDEEDAALAEELLSNEKERAEHVMLVDLGRNDVGRVSSPGSVKLDKLMEVEKYSHVMHIVSKVSGDLAKDKTIYDAFRAIFPAGTVSGAPKIRAMQLVAELEKERRGVYAGALGYVSFSQVLDMCISIRTIVVKDGCAYFQAGGGIVYDSDPEEEYVETVNKMMGMVRAVEKAEWQANKCFIKPSTPDRSLQDSSDDDQADKDIKRRKLN